MLVLSFLALLPALFTPRFTPLPVPLFAAARPLFPVQSVRGNEAPVPPGKTHEGLHRLDLFGVRTEPTGPSATAGVQPTPRAGAADVVLPGAAAASPPSVDALIAEALANNPTVPALEERIAAAREMVAPSAALADPMVEGMYTEAGFPGWTVGRVDMSMIGVEVRQDLSRRRKRNARQAVAEAEVATLTADIEVLRRQIVVDVRRLYARIFGLDQELETLKLGRELLELLEETTASRYSAGEGDQEGVIKAQLMSSRLEERQTDLVASRRTLVAALGRLLNRADQFSIDRIDALDTPVFPDENWNDLTAAGSADVIVKHRAVEVAERRVEAAKLELKANFSTSAGAYYRGSIDPVVTLKFGVELPWWRKQKQEPLIRAAQRELEAARRELEAEQSNVKEMTSRIAAMKEQSETQIQRYQEAILPQTSAAFDAARSAYLTNRGDFSTLIEDFNFWLDARTELARRESDRYAAWAELQALTNSAPAAADRGTHQ